MSHQDPNSLFAGECLDLGYRIFCPISPRIEYPSGTYSIGQDEDFRFFPTDGISYETPRWWTVKTCGYSIERSFGIAGPTPPIRDGDVRNGDLASPLKVRVTDGENCRWIADVGAGSDFSFLSKGCNVEIEAPAGAVQINDLDVNGIQVPIGGPFPFFVSDSIVAVSVINGIAPLGGTNGTLTRTYRTTGALATNIYPIPARAKRVTFAFPAALGAIANIRFVSNVTAPTPGRVILTQVTVPIGESTSARVIVPQDAVGVVFVPAIPATVTASWELSW